VPATGLEWRVERCCRNAWPALWHVWLGDWLVHFGEGLTRRGNSASPLRSDYRLSAAFVDDCETLYARRRQPAIFRIPTIAESALDRRLDEAGYDREGESLVLYGEMKGVAAAADSEVLVAAAPDAEWFSAMAALQGHSPQQARTYRRIVARLALPAAFVMLGAEGAPAALAYGVLHDRLVCVESVVADRERRRRGFARRVVSRLAAWGRDAGAEGICLEVEATNMPAIALYNRLGLGTELYRYHYRRQPDRG
jgi:N-acetylglutamate synthase